MVWIYQQSGLIVTFCGIRPVFGVVIRRLWNSTSIWGKTLGKDFQLQEPVSALFQKSSDGEEVGGQRSLRKLSGRLNAMQLMPTTVDRMFRGTDKCTDDCETLLLHFLPLPSQLWLQPSGSHEQSDDRGLTGTNAMLALLLGRVCALCSCYVVRSLPGHT